MHRVLALAPLVLASALVAGCAGGATPAGTPSPSSTSPAAFDPAAAAQVFPPVPAPAAGDPVRVVVMVPGGGWQTHDSSGFVPLAQALADDGSFVVTTEYRAGREDVGFPDTLHDVLCSAGYAVEQARAAGLDPGSVTLIGHSAGGHLSALAGVSDGALAGPCSYAVPRIDAVVGLAGIYDVRRFAEPLESFFGVAPEEDPALWDSGDPIHYVEAGDAPDDLRVLLLHGDADSVVPVGQSELFAAALDQAGLDVELDVLADEDHMSVITVGVAAETIQAWLRAAP